MRRRLTLVLVGSVALAFFAAGLGVLLITKKGNERETELFLQRSAHVIVAVSRQSQPRVLRTLLAASKLEGAKILRLMPAGSPIGPLPSHLPSSVLDPAALARGETLGGVYNRTVYIAEPFTLNSSSTYGMPAVVILTRTLPALGRSGAYLLFVGLSALVLAFLLAEALTLRITRPFYSVIAGTKKIAEGDLATRIELNPASSYPEIRELAEAVNQMAEHLSFSKASEQRFLLSISHDLRTPLTSIVGFSEAILDDAIDDPKTAAATILRESTRLERLVGDLLELAKLQANRFSFEFVPTELSPLLSHAATSFQQRCRDRGVNFDYSDLLVDQIKVMLDPARLLQMLFNLLENALRYSRKEVELSVETKTNGILISVRDDGKGIAEEARNKIFRQQYKGDHNLYSADGSGLGLLIVAELAQAMELRVDFTSPLPSGEGTEMRILIPLSAISSLN